jgi:hypothetical protein
MKELINNIILKNKLVFCGNWFRIKTKTDKIYLIQSRIIADTPEA